MTLTDSNFLFCWTSLFADYWIIRCSVLKRLSNYQQSQFVLEAVFLKKHLQQKITIDTPITSIIGFNLSLRNRPTLGMHVSNPLKHYFSFAALLLRNPDGCFSKVHKSVTVLSGKGSGWTTNFPCSANSDTGQPALHHPHHTLQRRRLS